MLDIKALSSPRQVRQGSIIDKIKTVCRFVTAEKIYDYLLRNVDDLQVYAWSELFMEDAHRIWDVKPPETEATTQIKSNPDSKDGNSRNSNDMNSDNWPSGNDTDNSNGNNRNGNAENTGNKDGTGNDMQMSAETASQLEKDWKEISEKMQIEIEAFSKEKGNTKGSFVQNLNAVNREKYNYTQFLKKFSVMGEAMRVNDDEFDYIF